MTSNREIINKWLDFETRRDEANKLSKEKFENKFHPVFCLIPRQTTKGKWVWFNTIYVRYKAIRKTFLKYHFNGTIEVTDPWAHYMFHEYNKGMALEIITKEDFSTR